MGIRLKQAETASEFDDVFRVRRQVYSVEEGKFGGSKDAEPYLLDRFDAHPGCANLIAYEGVEPIATIRLNTETGAGLPADTLYDFSAEKNRLAHAWRTRHRDEPVFGSAGMLAVRQDWRRRRDVIRALFKLAATVARSWGWTHVLITANHENASMYQRVGFKAVGDKIWIDEIGNHVLPMVALLSDFYARTVGKRLDDVALLRCFSKQFQRAVFRAGERLFSESEEADECYVVDVGSVRITTRAKDGRELVFAVLGPGEIVGEMALIGSSTRSADATAESDTEVVVLRRDVFLDGLQTHPGRLHTVLGFISDRLRRTGEFAKLLAYGSPEQRLEFALKGYIESARFVERPDGTGLLKAGPADLAAAAGTDEREALAFLDALKSQGHCDYTDKQIHFLLPLGDQGRPGSG